MNKSQSRSSAIEPDSFYAENPLHYEWCPNQESAEPCDLCDEDTRQIRADYAAASREWL